LEKTSKIILIKNNNRQDFITIEKKAVIGVQTPS
jgi:hypothetical protein